MLSFQKIKLRVRISENFSHKNISMASSRTKIHESGVLDECSGGVGSALDDENEVSRVTNYGESEYLNKIAKL